MPAVAASRLCAAFVPLFPSSANKLFNCVVACAVGVPCAVIDARAAPTFSNDTPIAAAVGVTCARFCPSSSTVVIPLFCVCISIFAILSASSVSIPYAFIVFASAERDVSTSVKPAFASFAAVSRNAVASPISSVTGIPAESAEYNAPPSSSAANPVALDNSSIFLLRFSVSTFTSPKSVDAFAIDVSKLPAACTLSANALPSAFTPSTTAPSPALIASAIKCPLIISPSLKALSPDFSASSPNSFIAFASSSADFSFSSNASVFFSISFVVFITSASALLSSICHFVTASLFSPYSFFASSSIFSTSETFFFCSSSRLFNTSFLAVRAAAELSFLPYSAVTFFISDETRARFCVICFNAALYSVSPCSAILPPKPAILPSYLNMDKNIIP